MSCIKTRQLSAEEAAALEYARRHGGTIERTEYGWGTQDLSKLEDVFSTGTVKALVAAKRMKWTLHERRNGSSVPIEARLVDGAA